MEEERKQAQEWERRARRAIPEGRDGLAAQALRRGLGPASSAAAGDELGAGARAAAAVTDDPAGADLPREFAMREGSGTDTDVAEKLRALKRDMGLLAPAAAAEKPRALGSGEEVEVADAEILDADESESGDESGDISAEEVEEPKQ